MPIMFAILLSRASGLHQACLVYIQVEWHCLGRKLLFGALPGTISCVSALGLTAADSTSEIQSLLTILTPLQSCCRIVMTAHIQMDVR